MKKYNLIDKAQTPDGSEIALYLHDADYSIRVNGIELMSTRQQYSEQVLAEVICQKYSDQKIRVLVGGLGFGFTLKTVLDNVGIDSEVVVAELLPCVIAWNSNPEFNLASHALGDDRVSVVQGDVLDIVKNDSQKFDAIILDVDNGPEPFTTQSNNTLYSKKGLSHFKAALNRKGTLGIWSVAPNKRFEKVMRQSGYRVETVNARARPGKGATHTIFIGMV